MKNNVIRYVVGYRNLRKMVVCYFPNWLCDATFPEHLMMLVSSAKPLTQCNIKG